MPSATLFDPQLAPAQDTYALQSFDNSPASIQLGPGWYRPEPNWGPGHTGVAWAQQRARIFFGSPLGAGPFDLVAMVAPFSYTGSPPQTVRPRLNGRALPTVAVADGWNELRIPLPQDLLTLPVNVLHLRFDHAMVPAEKGLGRDDRSLAAAFDAVAIVPRGERLAQARSTISGRGRSSRKLRLESEPIVLPLPPATRYQIRMGATQGQGRLALDFETLDGKRQRLWEGRPESLAWRSFALHTPSPRTARLRLTQESRGDSPVELDPPEVRALPRRERTGGPPDVFLYLIDTLRADAVGVYGSPRPTTPNIDRFSSDALVFTRALSPAPWTLPATTSILSGLYPSHHGVIVAGDRLPQTAPWLPALLSRRGFQTLGVSQWLLGGDAFGLDRGFQGFYANVYQNAKTPSANVRWFLWRYLLAPRAAGAGARPPLFAYLHVVDPHALYRPGRQDRAFADEQPGGLTPDLYDPNVFMQQGYGKDPAEVAHLRALYDGEVHAADRQFGAFLEQLRFFDLYEESLIILVGDHGEEFFEHGGFDHGRTLYNELLRVPLIVKLPASWRRTGRVETPVSTLSIAPTVLQVAGQGAGRVTGGPSAGAGFDGPSLTEVARQETPRSAAPLFAETHVEQVNQRAAFLEAVKCILNVSGLDRNAKPAPAFEAFNLTDDPREKKPLALSDHGVLACKRGLEAWMAPKQAPAVEHGALAPEDLAKLRALGYIH